MDASKLVKAFVRIRDAKAAKTKQFEAEIQELDDQLSAIRSELLEICKATNQDGGRTEFGTFTRTVKTRYWTSDWESMHKFVKENDALDLLERRISQGAMKTFIAENPDKLPMGLNVDSHYDITVRRTS